MEAEVYQLLNAVSALVALVSGNVRPVRPPVNSPLPHAWYTLAAQPTSTRLTGASDRTPYTLTLTVAALDLEQISTALAAAKLALDGYHDGGGIKGVFFTGQSEGQDANEVPYRSQTYSVWG